MNVRARVDRIERALRGIPKLNPANVAGILEFFQTGDAARIPAGVSLTDLQAAAARQLRAGIRGQLTGLEQLREALSDQCRGDVFDYIAEMDPLEVQKNMKIFWPDYPKPGTDGNPRPADLLLNRLGLLRFLFLSYGKPETEARP